MSKMVTHKDVEFHVEQTNSARPPRHFGNFWEACAHAISQCLSNGMPVTLDVVIWSKAGAGFWGGDDAVEEYKEDPEASVFERIVVRAESQGRVP
jgi:hypothetical protein